MAQRFQNVALIGASGNLGPSILHALRTAQPPFHSITILTRPGSNTDIYPSDVTVKQVDYSSSESLVSALSGIDALISAVTARSAAIQKLTIDAAVTAGVKFFIPSEFGLDSTEAALEKDFPGIWTPKVQIQEYLAGLQSQGKIDYALIFTGLFLDWGMDGFIIDLKNKKVELWDDGEAVLSFTTRASIAKSVVGALGGGKTTTLRVKNINLSQKRLFELAKLGVGAGDEEWTVTGMDTKEAWEGFKENVKAGRPDASYAFLKRAIVLGGHGSLWSTEEDDSERLGLREWTEGDVVEMVRGIVGGQ